MRTTDKAPDKTRENRGTDTVTRRDRHMVTDDRSSRADAAGLETVSATSILAGTFTAFGVLLIAVGIATGVAGAFDVDFGGFSNGEWRDIGMGGGAILAFVVLLAFLFGGYTAGRMAARRGVRHGFWVLVLSLFVVGAAAALTENLADTQVIGDEIRQEGIPTDADTWTDIGIGVGVAVLVTMIGGALVGGLAGERWHDRMARRGADAGLDRRSDLRRSDDVAPATATGAKAATTSTSGHSTRDTGSRGEGQAMEIDSLDASGDGRSERIPTDGNGNGDGASTIDLREQDAERR